MSRPASRPALPAVRRSAVAMVALAAAVIGSVAAPRPAEAFFCFGFSFDGGGPSIRFGFGNGYGFRGFRYAPHLSPYVMPLPPPPPPRFAYRPGYGRAWPPPPPPWAYRPWFGPRRW